MKFNTLLLLIFCSLSISQLKSQTPCSVAGMAGIYPCDSVCLQSYTPVGDFNGATGANDIWGWEDTLAGKEYAILGLLNGTGFADVTNPTAPIVIGTLPGHITTNNSWRDIKVVNNHAYIGSELNDHGVQIFDLTRLDTVTSPPVIFTETGWIDLGTSQNDSHNIVGNEEKDLIYVVGSEADCGTPPVPPLETGGLIAYDVTNPASPVLLGCNNLDGYSHDAVCFVYNGPDLNYVGKDICIGFNEDDYTIFDYSDVVNPIVVSVNGYPGSAYTHQGWMTPDHKYLIVDDELDETATSGTKTFVFDISDLTNPNLAYTYTGTSNARDHNQYVHGPYVYQSNYNAGLRILDVSDLDNTAPVEVGYFDVFPANNNLGWDGTWSCYPYLESGNILVSGRVGADVAGLFVLETKLPHYVLEVLGTGHENVLQGDTAVYCLDANQFGGFTNTDNLTVTGLPANSTFLLSENPIVTSDTLKLYVYTTATTPIGNYSITLTGTETPVNRVVVGLSIKSPPVPVELSSFEVRNINNLHSLLNWTTESEIAFSHFEIEKSLNSQSFDKIGEVFPVSPNSQTKRSYSFKDDRPSKGLNYYRLKSVDLDGTSEYSKIKTVEFSELTTVKFFPNPVGLNDVLNISFNHDINGQINIDVFNQIGQIVESQSFLVFNEKALKLETAKLSKGVYYIKINGTGFSTSDRIVVE